jgi:hypothetical protein
MDEIRIRHEDETKKAQVHPLPPYIQIPAYHLYLHMMAMLTTREQERDTLNINVHDIELAIDLGKSSQPNVAGEMIGTEVLLKRVADNVSNKSDSGGILKQIKEFNSFLERTALVLESSKN